MRLFFLTVILLLGLPAEPGMAAGRTIGVFVALADNAHQGIAPVPAAIGNGGDAEHNLYWGADEGLKGWFDRSRQWKRVGPEIRSAGSDIARADILTTRTYRHVSKGMILNAYAYRGTAIKRCIQDFEMAVQQGAYDLTVYIGHNGLMDFDLPLPTQSNHQSKLQSGRSAKSTDCIVLCCKSEEYFKARLLAAGGRPILLTTQFMYPGAFILHAIAEDWSAGASLRVIRQSAGKAYAGNQQISQKAGAGVFAELGE